MTTVVTETVSTETFNTSDLASAFTMPIVSPMIARPPYRYRDTTALNILFKTAPAVLDKLVPAPLKANLDQPMVFYIGHFQLADYDLPYNEAGLLVPVTRSGKPVGLYAVVLYLDKANPIVGGREVYGWPKKEAEQVLFQEEKGKSVAGVTRYGKQIINCTFTIEKKLDTIPPRPKDTIYFVKMIPSVEKDAPPDVLKLNSMTIDPDVIKELHVGRATLQFAASPYDSFLAEIPVKEIVYSEVIVHDFTLGYGQVVIDYLAK